MSKFIFCIFLLLVFYSCKNSESTEAYTYDTSNFKIFYRVTSLDTIINIKYVANPDLRFKLNPNDLELVESKMDSAMAEVNRLAKMNFDNWVKFEKVDTIGETKFRKRFKSEYKRQYVVEFAENGDKVVLVNCFSFPSTFLHYWDKYFIDAMGGGSNLFMFYVNLDRNSISSVSINAPM